MLGTAAMTAAQTLATRLRSDGSQQETQEGQGGDPWEQAPAPAQAARRVAQLFGVELRPRAIPLTTQLMHWGYGTAWGAAYATLDGHVRGPRALPSGLALGAAVWLASYAQLVPLGVYEPPWRYPPDELALELGYHAVYGTSVAGTSAALAKLAPAA